MPPLVALDKYEAVVRGVAAQGGAALRAILATCERMEGAVAEVLSHPAAALQACAVETLA